MHINHAEIFPVPAVVENEAQLSLLAPFLTPF